MNKIPTQNKNRLSNNITIQTLMMKKAAVKMILVVQAKQRAMTMKMQKTRK